MGPLSRVRQFLRRAFDEPDGGPVVRLEVDNRTFLLGLDELYRSAMKAREGTELLGCAEQVVNALGVVPAEVPVEGY
jgi:hypothetical protein